MSNTPPPGPGGRKRITRSKSLPITPVTFQVESILALRRDPNIVVVTGYDKDRGGKSNEITLYGTRANSPNPESRAILGKIVSFRVRLLSDTKGPDPKQSERVGNIVDYGGYIDEAGKFTF